MKSSTTDSMAEAPDITVCYFLRHGRTVANQSGLFRGNKNFPLSDDGIKDAYRAKKLFSEIPLSGIFSSDKVRATKTAEIVNEDKKVPVTASAILSALDIGEFSGQPRDKTNTDALQYYLDRPEEKIPGGESLKDFRNRIEPAIWEIFGAADDSGLPAILVCHSSVVHELGHMLYNDHKSILVEPGGVVAMYVKGGKISAEPIFKPLRVSDPKQATVS